jgi:hypothetical protein
MFTIATKKPLQQPAHLSHLGDSFKLVVLRSIWYHANPSLPARGISLDPNPLLFLWLLCLSFTLLTLASDKWSSNPTRIGWGIRLFDPRSACSGTIIPWWGTRLEWEWTETDWTNQRSCIWFRKRKHVIKTIQRRNPLLVKLVINSTVFYRIGWFTEYFTKIRHQALSWTKRIQYTPWSSLAVLF